MLLGTPQHNIAVPAIMPHWDKLYSLIMHTFMQCKGNIQDLWQHSWQLKSMQDSKLDLIGRGIDCEVPVTETSLHFTSSHSDWDCEVTVTETVKSQWLRVWSPSDWDCQVPVTETVKSRWTKNRTRHWNQITTKIRMERVLLTFAIIV